MSITADSPPRIEGSGITVLDVYAAYARDGYEPAEIASSFGIPLADVHEALAYYYRHAEELRRYDTDDVQTVERATEERTHEMVGVDDA